MHGVDRTLLSLRGCCFIFMPRLSKTSLARSRSPQKFLKINTLHPPLIMSRSLTLPRQDLPSCSLFSKRLAIKIGSSSFFERVQIAFGRSSSYNLHFYLPCFRGFWSSHQVSVVHAICPLRQEAASGGLEISCLLTGSYILASSHLLFRNHDARQACQRHE